MLDSKVGNAHVKNIDVAGLQSDHSQQENSLVADDRLRKLSTKLREDGGTSVEKCAVVSVGCLCASRMSSAEKKSTR